jgi:hypothetical protein
VSAGLPEPARREIAAAGDPPVPRIRPLCILQSALPASFLDRDASPTGFLRTGTRASLFRRVSPGIVVFLILLMVPCGRALPPDTGGSALGEVSPCP